MMTPLPLEQDSVSENENKETISETAAEDEEKAAKGLPEKGHNAVTAFANASKEMTDALLLHGGFDVPKVGDLITGQVVDIGKSGIVLDLSGRLTGLVRGRELDDESGEYEKLNIGDTAEATVLDLENEQGMIELSFRQAGHRKAWDFLQGLMEKGEVVDAKIIDANKGGLMVKVGNVEGFLPVSQLTVEHYPRVDGGDKSKILDRLKSYMNEMFKVKIITVKEKEEKLIVSEKAAWEKEQNEQLSKYEVGTIVTGKVTGVVDFGAFVEFGDGLEGLVHISELAWQRIENPKDIVQVGDEIKAKIIAIEGGRVSLSVKKLQEDPWKTAVQKYQVGQIVTGKVLKINPYGAFIELDPNIHGLAHVSEIGAKSKESGEVLKPGEEREFKILSLEPAAHRLGLGFPDSPLPSAPEAAPTEEAKEAEPAAETAPVEQVEEVKSEEPKEADV